MSLTLDWAGVTVHSTSELLWYLNKSPPPGEGDKAAKKGDETQDAAPTEPTPPTAGEGTKQDQPTEVDIPPPPPVVTTEKKSPNMFALTIGINDYVNVTPLGGCVADANAMVAFLKETLGVPPENITSLRNKQATREAIENAIAALAEDERIQKGDPIVIFYAGHGAEAPSPPGWSTYGKIQMLVPVDFVPEATGDKKRGQGVLDVKLGHLLQQLAEKKGDNISVIFDCCHSGSGTRDDEADPSYVTRGFELPKTYQVAPDLLEELPGTRATSIAEGFQTSGLLSHVLLAACTKEQTAKERQGRGAFTQAILALWKKESVELLTYKDVILHLPDLPLQNPQCEGVNQNRVLFDSRAAAPRKIYEVNCKNPNLFTLEAGDAHGVTTEAEFTIYSDRSMTTTLGKAVVGKTTAFQAELSPAEGQEPFEFQDTAYAMQTRVGKGDDIRLLVPLDARLIPTFLKIKDEMQRFDADKRGITFVDDESAEPNLKLFLTTDHQGEDVAGFEVMDPLARQYGLTTMPFTSRLDPTPLYGIFRSAADFYYNLNRSTNKSIIAPKIQFSCFRLEETDEYDDNFEVILQPVEEVGDLNKGGKITIPASKDYKYGFLIKNTSAVPLFVSVFYFDMSDLSVSAFYQPNVARQGETEVSIPKGGELKIGYGDSGTVPRSFWLLPDQNSDVGYIKLFLSTGYVDFSSVEQKSPFESERAASESKPKTRQIWDTMKIAVVIKPNEE